MFAIERDSCWVERHSSPPYEACGGTVWPDSSRDRLCLPAVALFDTSGICRAKFHGARDPVWSPDGTRLAFRTVRIARIFAEGSIRNFPEAPESVVVFTPLTGHRQTFPAPTEAVSWLDDRALQLEFGGLRYGLTLESGYVGTLQNQTRFVTRGGVSPDEKYVAHFGEGVAIWDYEVRNDGVWDHLGNSNFLPAIARLIDAKIARVSRRSFWLRGPEYPHHLCLGVGRYTQGSRGFVTRYRDCETVIIDVEKLTVTRRIAGAFVGSTADGEHVVVWQDGKLKFIKL